MVFNTNDDWIIPSETITDTIYYSFKLDEPVLLSLKSVHYRYTHNSFQMK
jgi:hypothetical protein